jgi:hypothetical protein
MHKKIISWITVAALTMPILGCYSTRTVSVQETEALKKTDVIKITTKDGRVFELTDVKIEDHQIKGCDRTPNSQRNWTWIVLNVDDIQSVELKKLNYYKTAITAGAVIWLFAELVRQAPNTNFDWKGETP